MAQLDTFRGDARDLRERPGPPVVAGPRGVLTRRTILAGSLISAAVGAALIVAHVRSVAVAGVLFGVHMAVQSVLQLLALHESKVPASVRRLLRVGGPAVFLLGALLVRGWADPVLLLGVWTGCGWLLRGFFVSVSVSVTSHSVSHFFVYDDLVNAATVSAGLLMTAFPFSSVGQLADVGGSVLVVAGSVEAAAAARRRPRIQHAND
ncbi:hypothetical protein ACIBCU_34985 [Streptomyces sp. NPDC051064]|uniref:hypothetical protein n=1 Tax=Streptomyces sp. NPDC051064 TaxID=3365641 RepID=UPI0037B4C793